MEGKSRLRCMELRVRREPEGSQTHRLCPGGAGTLPWGSRGPPQPWPPQVDTPASPSHRENPGPWLLSALGSDNHHRELLSVQAGCLFRAGWAMR